MTTAEEKVRAGDRCPQCGTVQTPLLEELERLRAERDSLKEQLEAERASS